MQLIKHTKPKMIISSEGTKIRAKDDVYYKNGEEEHIPYYTTTIFVPDTFTEEEMKELYVEEKI